MGREPQLGTGAIWRQTFGFVRYRSSALSAAGRLGGRMRAIAWASTYWPSRSAKAVGSLNFEAEPAVEVDRRPPVVGPMSRPNLLSPEITLMSPSFGSVSALELLGRGDYEPEAARYLAAQ